MMIAKAWMPWQEEFRQIVFGLGSVGYSRKAAARLIGVPIGTFFRWMGEPGRSVQLRYRPLLKSIGIHADNIPFSPQVSRRKWHEHEEPDPVDERADRSKRWPGHDDRMAAHCRLGHAHAAIMKFGREKKKTSDSAADRWTDMMIRKYGGDPVRAAYAMGLTVVENDR